MRASPRKPLLAFPLLGLLALALWVPSAQAMEFNFRFNGNKLAAGINIGLLKVKDGIAYELITSEASDICKEAEVEKPSITGGKPATTAIRFKLKNCTGKWNGTACTSEKAESEPLSGEQTENRVPSEGQPATRLVPVSGKVLFRFLLNCGLLGKKEFLIEGSTAAEYEGAIESEAEVRILRFPFPKITKVKNASGTELAVEPTSGGKGAFIGGSTEFKLEGGPKWGPF
jgi:hypothetical protein